jgi:hypothetical protein
MGAYAEYAVADEKQVGLKPSNIAHVEAGTIPLVGVQKAQAPWVKPLLLLSHRLFPRLSGRLDFPRGSTEGSSPLGCRHQ